MAKVPKGSWEHIWKAKGVDTDWRDDIRKYIGVCGHPGCRGRTKGVIIVRTVLEMSQAITEHRRHHKRRA